MKILLRNLSRNTTEAELVKEVDGNSIRVKKAETHEEKSNENTAKAMPNNNPWTNGRKK
ncbi:MAG: hypothetical protein P8Z77_16955 [Candidatus Thiodiazotropha sp.]